MPKPPLDPSTYANITEWKEDSIEKSFSGNHIEKKEDNMTEGAFSAARRKISSSSFSPCKERGHKRKKRKRKEKPKGTTNKVQK